jgi:hypothetical protein
MDLRIRKETMKQLSPKISESLVIFVAVWILYLLSATILSSLGYLSSDAIIRTGISLDLLAGFNRGKQAIISSFSLPPLQTLLLLPFAYFKIHLTHAFSAAIVSSACGAFVLCAANQHLKEQDFSGPPRTLLLILLAIHPSILSLFASGNNRAVSSMLLFAGSLFLARWIKKGSLRNLIPSAGCFALLSLAAPEGFLTSLLMLILVISVSLFRNDEKAKTESLALLAATPTLYALGLWMLFNWLIMGNWTGFLHNGNTYLSNTITTIAPFSRHTLTHLPSLFSAMPLFLAVSIISIFALLFLKDAIPFLLLLLFLPSLLSINTSIANPHRFALLFLIAFALLIETFDAFSSKIRSWAVWVGICLLLFLSNITSSFLPLHKELALQYRQKNEIQRIGRTIATHYPESLLILHNDSGYLFRYYNPYPIEYLHYYHFSSSLIPPAVRNVYLLTPAPFSKGKKGRSLSSKIPRHLSEYAVLEEEFRRWSLLRIVVPQQSSDTPQTFAPQ